MTTNYVIGAIDGRYANGTASSSVSYVQMHWYGRLWPVKKLVTDRGVWHREPGHAWKFFRGQAA